MSKTYFLDDGGRIVRKEYDLNDAYMAIGEYRATKWCRKSDLVLFDDDGTELYREYANA